MFYVRKKDGRLEFLPISPDKGVYWYTREGFTLYSGSLDRSRVDIIGGEIDESGIVRGGTIAELPAPAPAPRIFSKLKLRDNLAALGLWDTLKAAIESSEAVSERWTLAQDIREDDADFVALEAQLSAQFTASGTDLDEFLNQCKAEV